MSCLLGKKGVTYQYITYFHMYGNGEENSYSTLHYYLAIEFKVPNAFFFSMKSITAANCRFLKLIYHIIDTYATPFQAYICLQS